MNKPELYFKKFKYCKNETKKFNNITISLKSETLKTSELDELGKYPVVNSGLDLYGKYNKYNNLGDAFTIASRGEYVGNIHYFKDKFWAGGLCYPYKCINLYNTRLVSIYMEYNFYTIRKLFMNTTGIPAINKKDLETFKVTLPSNLEEQQKISTFLSAFDLKIEHESQIIEQLKQLKKSLLYKMFPTENSNVPELRFKGFTETWEQRKLGEMGSTFTGLSGKTKEDFGHGDAKFITYMNVFSNPIADLQMTETVEIDSKQNCVKAGDVFFTTSSETPEEVGMSCVMPKNADNTYLNSFCFGYRPTEKFDLNYLAYVLRSESFRKEMTFLAQGISRYNISKNKVMEVEIPVPSLEEQSKVGRYFSNLDNLITLHQYMYNKLFQVKNDIFTHNSAYYNNILHNFLPLIFTYAQPQYKPHTKKNILGVKIPLLFLVYFHLNR